MSKVLVVTPTYCTKANRRLPLLLQTIYGVKQQTHRDYLHIVVDDGSTDCTQELLERLSESDSNLKVFRKENGGSSAAINYGIAQALSIDKPDFITVCHSDDIMLPDSLDVRVKLARQEKAEFVYTDYVALYENGTTSHCRAKAFLTSDELYQSLLALNGILYPTMLWDADFFLDRLHGYDERITSSEDWEIALRSAQELIAMPGTHATAHTVTMIKRHHKDCLRIQNIQDGTKEKCYEEILQKHLGGDKYGAAMEMAKRTKLRRPRPLWNPYELMRRLFRVLRMRRLRSFLGLRRDMSLDLPTQVFLKELETVDYGLMANRAA